LRRAARGGYHAGVRVLAIDLGARRIGLAISDPSGVLARPLEVLTIGGDVEPVERVLAVVTRLAAEDDGLAAIVVGHPRRLDGTPNDQTPLVEAFAEALRGRVSQPVVLQDERLSSVEAESRLAARDRDWRSRKKKLDAAAAAVVLQDYLDEARHG
jgi:putative holliday junction resolvase